MDHLLTDCEAHFQNTSSHVFTEYITAYEIQCTTVILVWRISLE